MKNPFKFKDKRVLFGVNLNKYHWLGSTTLNFVDPTTKVPWSTAEVYFFLSKTSDKRKIVLIGDNSFYDHKLYTKALLWEVGELDLWACIHDQHSKWFKEYMLDRFNCIWDEDSKWWVKSNEPTPATTSKPEIAQTDNVISLDFGKKT